MKDDEKARAVIDEMLEAYLELELELVFSMI